MTTNFIVDVLGVCHEATPSTSGGRYTSITPARLIDTREASTATTSYSRTQDSAAKVTVNAPVGGKLSVPTSVASVALIVTGVSDPAGVGGYVRAYPKGTVEPEISNVNVNPNGDIRPNVVVVPLGADGSINFTLFNVAHVVVDVAGYFLDTAGAAGLYHVIAPSRQVDTRIPLGFGRLGSPRSARPTDGEHDHKARPAATRSPLSAGPAGLWGRQPPAFPRVSGPSRCAACP